LGVISKAQNLYGYLLKNTQVFSFYKNYPNKVTLGVLTNTSIFLQWMMLS